MSDAVFASLAGLHSTAQMMCEQLVSVADPENGRPAVEDLRVNVRAAALVNTSRSAGNDNAFAGTQFGGGRVARLHICIDAKFADTPGNQMRILTTRIENGDLGLS